MRMQPTSLTLKQKSQAIEKRWLALSDTNMLVDGTIALPAMQASRARGEHFYEVNGILDSTNAGTYTRKDGAIITFFEIAFKSTTDLVAFRLTYLVT